SNISKSHFTTTILLCLIYGSIILNLLGIFNFEILSISVTSILILIFYIFGLKTMASDTTDDSEEEDIVIDLSLNQIIFRFILTSIGLVLFSVLITYITDIISTELNLGAGLAGAIFLGIATSLPEVTSCISLVKRGNFNIAVGNILGSNIFNFLVLFIADVIYTKGTIYLFNDPETVNLLLFGGLATPFMLLVLNKKRKTSYIFSSICIMMCYVLFLAF
ncbi:MAG: sodium:calcium antiporter, partial [Peptostreptococcaceae bacterium]